MKNEKEQIEKIEKSERGWQYYTQIKKDRYCSTVTVKESSIAGRPCVWIFCTNEDPNYKNPPPHLTVAQAKKVIKGLQKFVDEAEDPEHWRNDPEYQEMWG